MMERHSKPPSSFISAKIKRKTQSMHNSTVESKNPTQSNINGDPIPLSRNQQTMI